MHPVWVAEPRHLPACAKGVFARDEVMEVLQKGLLRADDATVRDLAITHTA
jgi:hypothetical protein